MFILVHGAYHAGWCWRRLTPLLADAGHAIEAPDLPGHGGDPGWLGEQTLNNYAQRVLGIAEAADEAPVLVAHSMAGAVAVAAAEAAPDAFSKLIFLTAYIPGDGESAADLAKTDTGSKVRAEVVDVEGTAAIALKSGVLREAFYHDAQPRERAYAEDRIQLQSPAPFRERLTVTDANFGRVPKAAILCRNDRAISYDLQRRMAERAGCDPIEVMDSGHSPFATQPEALAQLLLRLA